jgi:multidrug efflux pump subunit AcrB
MSISEVAIRRPVFAWMLMFGLIVFGGLSFQRMGISNMPDVNFPIVNIGLRLDNAAPEVMEMNVVDIIEDAVMGIDGLKSVTSSISQGTANITCEFNMNRNIDVALQEVQNRILQINNQLPSTLYPPVISKINPEDQPIMGHGDGRRQCAAGRANDVCPQYAQRPLFHHRRGGECDFGGLCRSESTGVD